MKEITHCFKDIAFLFSKMYDTRSLIKCKEPTIVFISQFENNYLVVFECYGKNFVIALFDKDFKMIKHKELDISSSNYFLIHCFIVDEKDVWFNRYFPLERQHLCLVEFDIKKFESRKTELCIDSLYSIFIYQKTMYVLFGDSHKIVLATLNKHTLELEEKIIIEDKLKCGDINLSHGKIVCVFEKTSQNSEIYVINIRELNLTYKQLNTSIEKVIIDKDRIIVASFNVINSENEIYILDVNSLQILKKIILTNIHEKLDLKYSFIFQNFLIIPLSFNSGICYDLDSGQCYKISTSRGVIWNDFLQNEYRFEPINLTEPINKEFIQTINPNERIYYKFGKIYVKRIEYDEENYNLLSHPISIGKYSIAIIEKKATGKKYRKYMCIFDFESETCKFFEINKVFNRIMKVGHQNNGKIILYDDIDPFFSVIDWIKFDR